MSRQKTLIELRGAGVTIDCTTLNEGQFARYMKTKDDDEKFDEMASKLRGAASVTVMGVFNDKCEVRVNNAEWNDVSSFDDILRYFKVTNFPMRELIRFDHQNYCFMHVEYESGTWFAIEVHSPFDETKLEFELRRYELPNGSEVALLTATYDGLPMDYADPEIEGVEVSVCDNTGQEIA